MQSHRKSNDLFFTTLEQLHLPAPTELLNTLRAQLQAIQRTNPNSAQTAEACLSGLVSDRSTLLHVLTAAYLINGGVMLKHQLAELAAVTLQQPGSVANLQRSIGLPVESWVVGGVSQAVLPSHSEDGAHTPLARPPPLPQQRSKVCMHARVCMKPSGDAAIPSKHI